MRAEVAVTLRHGLWRDGERHAEARVRCLSGVEEAMLADLAVSSTIAERVTAVLTAAVINLGELKPVSVENVRGLSIGDREMLLTAVRRLAFGSRIEAIARCPQAGCGAMLDLDIDVERLCSPPTEGMPGPSYSIDVAGEGGDLRVRFRLPTGADQEAAARQAFADPRASARLLFERCILEVVDPAGQPLDIAMCAGLINGPLEDAIRRLDPSIETILQLTCPSCGHETAVLLDFGAYLLAELAGGETIYHQVDRIARAYHWSEADILRLPLPRRRRYLRLLAEGGLAA